MLVGSIIGIGIGFFESITIVFSIIIHRTVAISDNVGGGGAMVYNIYIYIICICIDSKVTYIPPRLV